MSDEPVHPAQVCRRCGGTKDDLGRCSHCDFPCIGHSRSHTNGAELLIDGYVDLTADEVEAITGGGGHEVNARNRRITAATAAALRTRLQSVIVHGS